MNSYASLGVTFTIIFASSCACEIFVNKNAKENATISLSDYLSKHYDKGIRPNCDTRTDVKLDIYVISFGKIEEANMEFSLFLYYRQTWRDTRLQGLVNKSFVLSRDHIDHVWFPDTYCSNAKTSNLMLPDTDVHSMLKLSPDGSIFYSRNAHVVAACDMNLRDFPMDRQFCSLSFGSYGFSDDDIKLSWLTDKILIENKEIAQFSIRDVTLSQSTGIFSSGNYTMLKATFVFDRRIGYYVIQTYIPCTFLVMLSWIVFWMSTEETGNRLTVGITTILTIMFLLGYTNGSLPKVSYIKGMDMYLMVSFLFIFLSIAECIIVDKFYKREIRAAMEKRKQKEDLQSPKSQRNSVEMLYYGRGNPAKVMHANPSNEENGKLFELTPVEKAEIRRSHPNQIPVGWAATEDSDKESKASYTSSPSRRTCATQPCIFSKKVDMASRVLFPCMWIVYNLTYWHKYIKT